MSEEIRAFPVVGTYENKFTGGTESHAQFGMTLRDWFAGQALAGWLASYGENDTYPTKSCDKGKEFCKDAYSLADAMMEARKGKAK